MALKARGRPTSFTDQLRQTILALYEQGKTDAQVARAIGVSRQTLHNWKGKDPELLDTIKESKSVADDLVEASLFLRATGYRHPEERIFVSFGQVTRVQTIKHYPPDVTAGIFWLANRQPERWKRNCLNAELPKPPEESTPAINFEEFCIKAHYPKPFEKQCEMKTFGLDETCPRLILGARGYGKTDYVVILGIAEKIKKDPKFRVLIITKSKERNASMLKEIGAAARANGVSFEKENSHCLRVTGLIGKDHSVSAVTIKTVTLRGRHPDMIIMDDPVTEDDTSDATRLLVEKKYNEVLKLSENVLIIGQPAHKYDLYAKLRPLVKKLEVPHGSIPELDHDLEAQRLAGVDEASIQASYFLTIMPEGTTPFDNVKYLDKFPLGDSAVAFVDPSFEGGDYTALSIVKSHMQGVAVVGFVWKKAWNHCIEEIVVKLKQYMVQRLCFETNSLGDQPIIMLRQLFGGGVVGRKSNGNKHSRIMAAGSYAHLIHLSKESDRLYTDQVVKYEYKAKNDDAPDSLASCLEWIGLIRGKQ